MMKKFNKFYILYLAVIALLFTVGSSVNAETGGGQVSTRSGINFLEGKTDPTEPSTEPSKEKPNEVPKKSGILPQTGEIMAKYSPFIIGLTLIVLLMIMLFKRRKKYEK